MWFYFLVKREQTYFTFFHYHYFEMTGQLFNYLKIIRARPTSQDNEIIYLEKTFFLVFLRSQDDYGIIIKNYLQWTHLVSSNNVIIALYCRDNGIKKWFQAWQFLVSASFSERLIESFLSCELYLRFKELVCCVLQHDCGERYCCETADIPACCYGSCHLGQLGSNWGFV